jgi:hypothetical protein
MGIRSNPSRAQQCLIARRDLGEAISALLGARTASPLSRNVWRVLSLRSTVKAYGGLGPEPLTLAACVSQRRAFAGAARSLVILKQQRSVPAATGDVWPFPRADGATKKSPLHLVEETDS